MQIVYSRPVIVGISGPRHRKQERRRPWRYCQRAKVPELLTTVIDDANANLARHESYNKKTDG
jgi:hypothetical protein